MKKLQKLPIGIQTFSKIREDNYLYIDKTAIASDLIKNYQYVFLSRPRRFGKSLFLDTLQNIFEGNKELFENLAIYDKWEWSVKYPVIKISWAGDFKTLDNLTIRAKELLKNNQERLGVVCQESDYMPNFFEEIIQKTSKKYNQKVVILIDEYDKPILDNIENIEQAKINREFMKGLYSIIKDNDQYIRFAMLTGVSKFTKTSIFSGLNNITDISLDKRYGDICGYTQNDIETSFLPYLQGVDLEKLKEWYNGYNFLGLNVYNPFDILLFIDKEFLYKNYWFETGTPTFLIQLIKENNYFLPKLSNLKVDEKLLNSFDIENLDVEVILYQAGYLTIEKMIERRRGGIEYLLKLPNEEVKSSFFDVIIDRVLLQKEKSFYQNDLYDSLEDKDIVGIEQNLKTIFASIPYNNYTKNDIQNYEGFYATVVYVYLQSLGLDIVGEDVTNRGRIDLTIKMKNSIYILEFKVGSDDALHQIKEKQYFQKYLSEAKEIYLVGINFDEKEKNISKFAWERL